MKPRVFLEPTEFLRMVVEGNAKVIKTGKILFQGFMCVTEASDYYYYTVTKEPLELPETTHVIQARAVYFE